MAIVELPRREQGELFIVANALPVKYDPKTGEFVDSPGGLTGAMKSLADGKTHWTGTVSKEESGLQQALRDFKDTQPEDYFNLHTVGLTQGEILGHYAQFSNSVLWPLLHGEMETVDWDVIENSWDQYKTVNQKFAEQIVRDSDEDDVVWVQDYQLFNVGSELRKMGRVNQNVNFFLHIPFPTVEEFSKLPPHVAKEIVGSLLDYNLVGFHVPEYQENFLRVVQHYFRDEGVDIETKEEQITLRVGDKVTKIGAFPIGIDYDAFYNLGASDEVQTAAAGIRNQVGDRTVLFDGGRNDYTKAFDHGLRMYQKMLQKFPNLAHKLQLRQVMQPTRGMIKAYQELAENVSKLVTAIKEEYGEEVLKTFPGLSRVDLVAEYVASDIAKITPKRDGMNLMAFEWIAAQAAKMHRYEERKAQGIAQPGEEDHVYGVMIIGKGAGAAHELSKKGDYALVVDPTDYEATAKAILKATNMSVEERKWRLEQLDAAVKSNTVHIWLDNFLRSAGVR